METAIERAQIRAQNLLYAQRGCCCGGRPEPGEQWRAEHPLTPAQKQKIHFDVLVEDCLQYDDIVREREEKAYTEAYNKLRADVEDKVQVFRVEVLHRSDNCQLRLHASPESAASSAPAPLMKGSIVRGHVRMRNGTEWLELEPGSGLGVGVGNGSGWLPLIVQGEGADNSMPVAWLEKLDGLAIPEVPGNDSAAAESGLAGGVGLSDSPHCGALPSVFHEGWLYKTRAGSYLPFKQVRERWFELRGTRLSWFDSEGGDKLGELEVTGAIVTPTETSTFHVAYPNGREDLLCAPSQCEADQWVSSIRGDSQVNLKQLFRTLEDSYDGETNPDIRDSIAVLRSSVFGISDHEIVPTRHVGADALHLLLDELWKQYDTDGTGFLDMEQLTMLVKDYVARQDMILPDKLKLHARKLLERASKSQHLPIGNERSRNVVQMLAKIEDGILEVVDQTSQQLRAGVESTASRAFQAIDQDNDGIVSRDEFQHRFVHYMNELVGEPPLVTLRKLLISSFPEVFPNRHALKIIEDSPNNASGSKSIRVDAILRSVIDSSIKKQSVVIDDDMTVGNVKKQMMQASELVGRNPSSYVVRVDDPTGRTDSFFLTHAESSMALLPMLPTSECQKAPRLELVPRSTFRMFAAQHIRKAICRLTRVGRNTSIRTSSGVWTSPEVKSFQREMKKLRKMATVTDFEPDSIEQVYLNQRVRLQDFAETTLARKEGGGLIVCRVYFGKHSTKLECDVRWTASKVIGSLTVKPVFQVYIEETCRGHLHASAGQRGRSRGIKPVSTYALKVVGFDDFLLAGGDQMADVLSVRDQLYKGKGSDEDPVDLMLMTKESAEEMLAEAVAKASAFDVEVEAGPTNTSDSDDSDTNDSESEEEEEQAALIAARRGIVRNGQTTGADGQPRARGRTRAAHVGRQQWWSNIDTPFSLIVRKVEGLSRNGLLLMGSDHVQDAEARVGQEVYVEYGAYFGDTRLGQNPMDLPHRTPHAVCKENERGIFGCKFNSVTNMNIAVRNLPRACVLCFTVKTVVQEDGVEVHKPLGWVNTHVYDHTGRMSTGTVELRLWPDGRGEANPIATCVQPTADVLENTVVLTVELCIGDNPLTEGSHDTRAKIYHSDEFYNVRKKQRQSIKMSTASPSRTLEEEMVTLRKEQLALEMAAVIDVEIFENQRRHPLHDSDFRAQYLTQGERSPWSDDEGQVAHGGPDDPALLRDGFDWVTAWRLQGHSLTTDGWQYAPHWNVPQDAWHQEKEFDDLVRRQRWIRTMSPHKLASVISKPHGFDKPVSGREPEPEPELHAKLLSATNTSKVGWLWKRGGSGPKESGRGFFTHGRRNWKRRWFVVVKDKLMYYESQDDFLHGRLEKGHFWLWDGVTGTPCQLEDTKEELQLPSGATGHLLTLVSSERAFLLAAESSKEMSEWHLYLRQVLDLDPPSRDEQLAYQNVLAGGWHSLHHLHRYRAIINSDPMWRPASVADAALLYAQRKRCQQLSEALPKFLLVVNWTDQIQRQETINLVQNWPAPPWQTGLQLLDARYAHALVRSRATHALEQIGDDQLLNVMLQLIQTLKYEPYHSNALASFLLTRALKCPSITGHRLYWYLRSEMHVPQINERFGLMLDGYVKALPPLLRERLNTEAEVVTKLMLVGSEMKNKAILPADRNRILREKLRALALPDTFRIPLSPRYEACGLDINKCFVLDSAQRPIWLVFQNKDTTELAKSNMVPPDHRQLYVILKKGDDLRQDILTLQMIEVMDQIWKAEGMDLGMLPYGCISTGDEEGFVEVVTGATTCADIIRTCSESQTYGAIFGEDHYYNWLKQYNTPGDEWDSAVDLFMRSNAGYCVATYILGIGDRHPSNIMMRKNGQFFHIDFGHFLGNFKSKYGLQRETAPFVFTPAQARVLGGVDSPLYKQFVELCCRAYNSVRRARTYIITLFRLMLSTGIPELQREADSISKLCLLPMMLSAAVDWLQATLTPQMTNEEAAQHFKEKLTWALSTRRDRIYRDLAHIWAH